MFEIARINKSDDMVENLEFADQSWIDEHQNDDDCYFIKYDILETIPYIPFIGYKYEKDEQWFHYPPVTWVGNYSDELLEIFETEPELREQLESLEDGSKEFALVVREIEHRFREKRQL